MLSSSEKYGLPKNVELEVMGPGHLAIVRMVKSRIISKDAEKIVEMANSIRQKDPGLTVSLICSGNICSKSIQLLEKNAIGIFIDEER